MGLLVQSVGAFKNFVITGRLFSRNVTPICSPNKQCMGAPLKETTFDVSVWVSHLVILASCDL